MFTVPEQFTNATKTAIDSQIAMMTSFGEKAFAHIQKVTELNLAAAKQAFVENTESAQQLLSAKGPQEFLTLATANAKPAAEKAMAYGRHLADIASAAQAEFSAGAESVMADSRRKVSALVEDVAKNAPAGSEQIVEMVKTAMGNANAGYDQFSKTAKQAAETIEANVNSSVSKFTEATDKVTARATKK